MDRELWVIDSETDPFLNGRVPKPFVWGAYNGDQFVTFQNAASVVNFFRKKFSLVYAHNGGKFDFHFMLDYLEPYTDLLIINGRLVKFEIDGAEYRDSYSILPMPLSAYKKDEIDYKIFEKDLRNIPSNKEEIIKYLKKDCEYLFDLVSSFVKKHGSKITIASAAMDNWEKRKLYTKQYQSQSDFNGLKKYYYGGRVECFEKGVFEKTWDVADIKSAYPHAMRFDHPYGNINLVSKSLPQGIKNIQQCFITLECKSQGAFPLRERNGSLSFPHYAGEYNVTGWEYMEAQRLNLISNVKIKKVMSLSHTISFKKYVDDWFHKKESAKKGSPENLIAKLFLNSLYGKFAQDASEHLTLSLIPSEFSEDSRNHGYEIIGQIGTIGHVTVVGARKDKVKFYNVGTAASITGFVRAELMRALSKVKRPVYCDTDSIICENSKKIESTTGEVGSWESEGKAHELSIAGKKMYSMRLVNNGKVKEKVASKGVRLSFDEIRRVAKGETVVYNSPAPTFSLKKNPGFMSREISRT